MNHRDLTNQLAHESLGKTNADVLIIDGEGFTHIPMAAFWDPEGGRWIVRTRFQTDEEAVADGPGYPVT